MDPEANSFSKEAELLGFFLWFLLSTTQSLEVVPCRVAAVYAKRGGTCHATCEREQHQLLLP